MSDGVDGVDGYPLDCLSYICIVSRYKDYTFDYDDMAGYLHYIQLQFGIEPSEGSWRSKERHIFRIKDLDS